LHLLAPQFFPLWDNDIAKKGYSVNFKGKSRNADIYVEFMQGIKLLQLEPLIQQGANELDLLKAIDEYNYCKYTQGWI